MKRYDLDLILGSMEEDPEGEWVRYEDANATIALMRESIEEYHKLAESQRESISYLESHAAQLRAKLAASPLPEGM